MARRALLKYQGSEKAKERKRKYRASEAGQAVEKRYQARRVASGAFQASKIKYRTSEKGRQVIRNSNARRFVMGGIYRGRAKTLEQIHALREFVARETAAFRQRQKESE